MPVVLFLCSGNYYRSRFAEHLFNHLAAADRGWQAQSQVIFSTAKPGVDEQPIVVPPLPAQVPPAFAQS